MTQLGGDSSTPTDVEIASIPSPRLHDRLRVAVETVTGGACVTLGREGVDPVELDGHAALVTAEALKQAAYLVLQGTHR